MTSAGGSPLRSGARRGEASGDNALRFIGQVLAPVPEHRVAREPVAGRSVSIRRSVEVAVGDRIDQDLSRQLRTAAVARTLGDHRGQVPARAVASNRDPIRVGTDVGRVIVKPVQACPRILDRGGKRILRGKAVVERKHNAFGSARERAAHRVVRVEVADDPAAAMHIKECGQRALRRRRVQPIRDLAAGTRQPPVLDERDIFELTRQRRRAQSCSSDAPRRRPAPPAAADRGTPSVRGTRGPQDRSQNRRIGGTGARCRRPWSGANRGFGQPHRTPSRRSG